MDPNWFYQIEQASDMSKITFSVNVYAWCPNKTITNVKKLANKQFTVFSYKPLIFFFFFSALRIEICGYLTSDGKGRLNWWLVFFKIFMLNNSMIQLVCNMPSICCACPSSPYWSVSLSCLPRISAIKRREVRTIPCRSTWLCLYNVYMPMLVCLYACIYANAIP